MSSITIKQKVQDFNRLRKIVTVIFEAGGGILIKNPPFEILGAMVMQNSLFFSSAATGEMPCSDERRKASCFFRDFARGIGGIAVVLYNLIFQKRDVAVSAKEHNLSRHKFHIWTLLSAPVILIMLLATTNLNPLHSSIIAMVIGGLATWYCRPDLKKKMITSAFLFPVLYFVYLLTLIAISPGYV